MRFGPLGRWLWGASLLLVCAVVPAAGPDRFERIPPAQAGYDPERLAALAELLQSRGSEALLLLHEGKVFFEWGDIHQRRLVHSVRKALLSSLAGRCVAQGRLRLDASVRELGLDEEPPRLSADEQQATLQQLLQSRSGIYLPAAAESSEMQAAKPPRGRHAPGTHWHYNNWDFNAAGAAVERACGPLFERFDRDIAKPLGMMDWQGRIGDGHDPAAEIGALDAFYQHEPARSRHPAYHFRLSAHDLALYGQLFLQRGRWNGQQLVPADWIERSTQPVSQVDPSWGHAYGWLWDVLMPAKEGEPAAFFHTGVDRHMLGIYPQQGLVMVHRVDTESGKARFTPYDLVRVIRAVHGARMEAR